MILNQFLVMANIEQKRKENIVGNFFVDSTCIDCDTCRWMAPEVFADINDQSAVFHQPENETERVKALQALLACPTASIGVLEKSKEINNVQNEFPLLISDNVYHCGYHSKKSFGATSYFIQRPEGNILVDSPRFVKSLVDKIENMGGIKYMYLTHIDDIAEHQKFKEHFDCKRILHEKEIEPEISDIEIKISGLEPFNLEPDCLILPVPGHTAGHTVLLYKNQFLFTGDHLAWSERLNHLYAFRGACWYSWKELIKSMEKLSEYTFEWVLPGHGRRFHGTKEDMKIQMSKCLAWMKSK
jgi:glyoxylase-like metal-dependent hydrolase (beta-lactamase superfamily II)/ferredoxin